jgi:hypothetical protein
MIDVARAVSSLQKRFDDNPKMVHESSNEEMKQVDE